MTRSRDTANIDTILTTKGDIYAASAAFTPIRLAVGNNGDTLLADSSTSTGLRYNPQNALTNPVINGGFDIWQRGTSFSNPNSIATSLSADRWNYYRAAGFTTGITLSRQTISDTTNLPNIQYCARVQRAQGNSSTANLFFAQNFESVNSIPYAGKSVTMSFYARKGTNFTASSDLLQAEIIYGTGTDQNVITGFAGQASISTNVTLTTTWQRFVLTGTIPTTATQLATLFRYIPVGTAGADDWYEITGVQIDLGTYTASSAPTFRRSGGTLAGELAACQRYYQRRTAVAAYTALATGYVGTGTTTFATYFHFPVTMRVAPTFGSSAAASFRAVISGAAPALTAIAARNLAPYGSALDGTTTGLTTGYGGELQTNNDATAYLEWSAEL